jgi:hypothetical protein
MRSDRVNHQFASGKTMRRIALWLSVALFVLLSLNSLRSQTALVPGGVVDPKLIGPTDPDYAPRFHIGTLVFRIPNRFLVFPWPTGKHPFDRATCSEGEAANNPVAVALCKARSQSVYLRIPVPGSVSEGQNFDSFTTLGFQEGYDFPTYSVEEFATQHDERWVRNRVPGLDTEKYSAFHDAWISEYARKAPPNILSMQAGQYVFINKKKEDPRRITCQTATQTDNRYRNLSCAIRISLLGDKYPQESSGRYPYTLEFTIPGTKIDNAAELGMDVTQAVLAFIDPATTVK